MSREKEIIVGGQAVMEGVMMRSPNSYAVAVRRQDGTIASKSERLPKLSEKYPILSVPILRGGAVLIHSMLLGLKAINFSASVAFEDMAETEADQEKKKNEAEVRPAVQAASATGALLTTAHTIEAPAARTAATTYPARDNASAGGVGTSTMAVGSIAFMLFINVFLFIVLPFLLTNFLFLNFGWGHVQQTAPEAPAGAAWYQAVWTWIHAYLKPVRPSISFNLVDGMIRMLFFILMIYGFSRLKDIKRIFEYHGAEHKTVYAWEAGEELTVENAQRYPRQHPRCGTSFLMVVMLVSIVLFSAIKFDLLILNMLMRIVMIPLIAGLSYEIIRAAGSKETSRIFSIITRPGIWLQNLTTKEPSAEQLEVAIYALKESLKLEPDSVVGNQLSVVGNQ
ncbi:MAG: DUF1385 domain-containing protein [Blastocatellia bacterium]|nr:DUF1385 domain-containing protein [Blastocatellia bacterium]